MSADVVPTQQTAAKVAGFLYLLQMATAIFGYYAKDQLIVRDDAVQTARNIAASEGLFRIGIASDLITVAVVIILLWALYVVLKPINENVALLAALLRLAENSIAAVATLNGFLALRFLGHAAYLQAFETTQLQVLARIFIGVQGTGLSIAFLFCGLGSAVFSYLWWKSRYIPRALAGWGVFSSLLLTIGTLAIMVLPGLGTIGLSYMVPMFLYEVGLGLWLVVKGIKEPGLRFDG